MSTCCWFDSGCGGGTDGVVVETGIGDVKEGATVGSITKLSALSVFIIMFVV